MHKSIIMLVTYQAEFHYTKEKEELSLTRILPDGTQDTSPVNLEEIHQLEDQTRNFTWINRLIYHSK